MERENWSWTNPSLWSAQKNNYKIFGTNLFVVEIVRPCFQHGFYCGWILKSYKPKPPARWIQKQKKPAPLCCILHIFQTCHLQYKADRARRLSCRKKRWNMKSSFYLDCFEFGSLITKHSFKFPNLLKYSCSPSETDGKNGPLRNRELNHSRLFQTWLIPAHL